MATWAGLVATAQGSTGTINLAWDTEPDGCTGVQVQYKTIAWHNWGSQVAAGTYYKNNFSATDNYTYEFRLILYSPGVEFTDSAIDCTRWVDTVAETLTLTDGISDEFSLSDTINETLTLTDAVSEAVAYSDSINETLTLSDSATPLATLSVDYQYYFGSYDGQVYTENSAYLSDATEPIDAYINLKQGDFADQDPECLDKWKTIYEARLWYVDVNANATTTLRLSTDGGTTWTDRTVNLGNGDGTIKVSKFNFITTGHTLMFRVLNNSSDQDFQWIALQVYYSYAGDYF